MSNKSVLLGISATIAAAFTLQVAAQDEDQYEATVFEEVIVTAAKREQTLQKIPIAVTVVTADMMEKAQINDIKDLQRLLTAGGYDTGGADGVVGPNTRLAIKAFQKKSLLPADGYPTMGLLERLRGG